MVGPQARTPRPAIYRTVASIVLAGTCAACMSLSVRGPPSGGHTAGPSGSAITVGSFDFPESVLLADVYAMALEAKGLPVRILPDLGSRELVDPAVMGGPAHPVPERPGPAPRV